MNKIIMAFAASMVFGYATAQLEPKTTQNKVSDTVDVPVNTSNSDDNIANKGIIH